MDKKTEATVLMSVYNGEAYLRESVESILNQTYGNFEFIIVNNCSTDATESILASYKDSRIRLINNKINVGLTKALNIGLKEASGKYIARMDADDISSPDRLGAQVDLLEKNPSIGAVGIGKVVIINEKGFRIGVCRFATDENIMAKILVYDSPMVHSAVMVRSDVIKKIGGYNEEIEFCQDWNLWSQIAKYGGGLTNIESINHYLRLHQRQTTHTFVGGRREIEVPTQLFHNIKNFTGLNVTEEEARKMYYLSQRPEKLDLEQSEIALHRWEELMEVLYDKSSLNKRYRKEMRVFFSHRVILHLLEKGEKRLPRYLIKEILKLQPRSLKYNILYILSAINKDMMKWLLKFKGSWRQKFGYIYN